MRETVKKSTLVVSPENREHINSSLKDLDDTERRLTAKLDEQDTKSDAMEKRFTAKLDEQDTKSDAMEKRLTVKIDAIDQKLDSLLNM